MDSSIKGHDDEAQLAQMGHKSELKRQFSLLYVPILLAQFGYEAHSFACVRSMLGLAFAILNVRVESHRDTLQVFQPI